MAVRKMDMTVEFIRSCRTVADSDPHAAHEIKGIVKVKPAVRPLYTVRGIQAPDAQGILGILPFPVDDPFIAPVL
jgi:hypothetical protein